MDADKYENELPDTDLRNMLLDEYLKNVCQKYTILRNKIYRETGWTLKTKLAEMGLESDNPDDEEEAKNSIGSITLSQVTSVKVYWEQ